MTTAPVIDLDALLAPVSDEAPAGIDPRADGSASSPYYQAKDARNAARAEERAAVAGEQQTPAAWATVIAAASQVVGGVGKDFEVCAWLVEALVRVEGLAGLRDGLRLIVGIAGRYWDGSFPELDEDGIEGKLTAIAGLSGAGAVGTLVQPLRLLPLTRGSLAAYSLWSYEQALDLQKTTDAERRQARIDAGAVTMEQFMQSVAETPAAELARTLALAEECLAALAEMSEAFEPVAAAEAPPVSGLRELLDQIAAAIRHFAADKLAAAAIDAPPAQEEAASGGQGEAAAVSAVAARTAGRGVDGYASRNEALEELTRIAGYFRKTEPQSPISYTLEDVVRRARMALPELLAELVQDPEHARQILLAAGIRNLEPPE